MATESSRKHIYQRSGGPLKLVIREAVVVHGEERHSHEDQVHPAFQGGCIYFLLLYLHKNQ